MAELDWRNPGDYAYLDDYDLHEWAWEFLRRNAEYRRAYFAFEVVFLPWAHAPRPLEGEEYSAFWTLHHASAREWGMGWPVDPRMSARDAKPHFQQRAGVKMLATWKAPEANPGDLWPGYPLKAVLQFDFRYSIETQIEIASEILRRFNHHLEEEYDYRPWKAKTKQFRRGQFRLYARILDAELQGASDGQITQVLFGDKDDPRRSMTKTRKTAHRMAAEGYRDLLLLPPREAGPLGGTKSPED